MQSTILAFAAVSAVSAKLDLSLYKCSLCEHIMAKTQEKGISFPLACESMFPKANDVCENLNKLFPSDMDNEDPTQSCQEMGFCPQDDAWYPPADASKIDFRVAKAHGGSNGYDKVRVSVISNHTIENPLFTYSEPFKYRWTDKVLNTGIASVTPGENTKFTIEGQDFNVFVPRENEGTRGIMIADPCFMSTFVWCKYSNNWKMFQNTVDLLNAASAHGNDISYWMVLGDNFYDQKGDATSAFFSALSYETKSKLFATTPGNHDFWVHSAPKVWVPADQLGNGFMQYYGQDTAAATEESPFDFTVNPDEEKRSLAHANNFFSFNKIGNTAFVGFSGAHSYEEMKPQFQAACSWATEANADHILLLSHWNEEGDGCESAMTTPEVYREMLALPECATVAPRMKYFMGHVHCNEITETDVGYMVGAQGMGGCGEWGIPVVDTTGDGAFKLFYFQLFTDPGSMNNFTVPTNNYDAILSCFKDNGVSGCYHLAQQWA